MCRGLDRNGAAKERQKGSLSFTWTALAKCNNRLERTSAELMGRRKREVEADIVVAAWTSLKLMNWVEDAEQSLGENKGIQFAKSIVECQKEIHLNRVR